MPEIAKREARIYHRARHYFRARATDDLKPIVEELVAKDAQRSEILGSVRQAILDYAAARPNPMEQVYPAHDLDPFFETIKDEVKEPYSETDRHRASLGFANGKSEGFNYIFQRLADESIEPLKAFDLAHDKEEEFNSKSVKLDHYLLPDGTWEQDNRITFGAAHDDPSQQQSATQRIFSGQRDFILAGTDQCAVTICGEATTVASNLFAYQPFLTKFAADHNVGIRVMDIISGQPLAQSPGNFLQGYVSMAREHLQDNNADVPEQQPLKPSLFNYFDPTAQATIVAYDGSRVTAEFKNTIRGLTNAPAHAPQLFDAGKLFEIRLPNNFRMFMTKVQLITELGKI